MKSLSALCDWLGADHPATGGSHRTEPPSYYLRNLPGEEIHLYIKNIDNTKLIRVVDKKDWATSVSVTGAALVCSLIVSAMVGPSCYGMLASRRMEYLREERPGSPPPQSAKRRGVGGHAIRAADRRTSFIRSALQGSFRQPRRDGQRGPLTAGAPGGSGAP
jgi:hypothetical protein